MNVKTDGPFKKYPIFLITIDPLSRKRRWHEYIFVDAKQEKPIYPGGVRIVYQEKADFLIGYLPSKRRE